MIIGIAAKARVGKDTFADFLVKEFEEKDIFLLRIAFADELKTLCMEYFNLTPDQVYGDLKEKMTHLGKNESGRLGLSSNPDDYWTPREIMQHVGSFYRRIDYDFWVNQLDKQVKMFYTRPDGVKNFIITDVRHVNECEYVKKNGILIKLIRGEEQKIHGMSHESEIALDDKPDDYFDIILHNNGTLDDLRLMAKNTIDAIIKLQNFKAKEISYDGK